VNEKPPVFLLGGYFIAIEALGRPAGRVGSESLRKFVDSHSSSPLIAISMQGLRRIDLAFASEAIVAPIQFYLGSTGIFLMDLRDEDVLEHVSVAAERMKVPVAIGRAGTLLMVGSAPAAGTQDALAFALARPQVRAAEFAAHAGISIANASNKFRQLWQQGFLLRSPGLATSGGAEFVYRRIG
jgi:hypothetical protein